MVDLSKKIPIDRVAALRKAGLGCQADWLAGDRSYEDLAAHPEWAFLAARLPGADIERLQEVVLRWGEPALRARFARHVPGADGSRLLAGL